MLKHVWSFSVWTFENRNIIPNDVTPFYVQGYDYFNNEMWNKGGMPDGTKSGVITLKQNI